MGIIKVTGGAAPLTKAGEVYILLTIDTADIEEARRWFDRFCAQHSLEVMFVSDIKGRPPLERPIGLAALIRFSVSTLKPDIVEIQNELQGHDNWRYELMRANWIEIKSFERTANESKRKVQRDGRISFKRHRYYITQHLRGEEVDLKVDDSNLKIYYNGTLVKTFTGVS